MARDGYLWPIDRFGLGGSWRVNLSPGRWRDDFGFSIGGIV